MVDQKAINLSTARVVPAILIGIAAYATYTVIGPLCIDYLLNVSPGSPRGARPGSAIAILVILFTLLFFMALTYARVLYIVAFDPGYVPRALDDEDLSSSTEAGNDEKMGFKGKGNKKEGLKDKGNKKEGKEANGISPTGQPYSDVRTVGSASMAGMENGLARFYEKDVFVCEGNGLPRYCSVCRIYKPDRSHHCREIARCVRKMDHFCPWVGGIISETNFKFFLQFTAYTFLYCTFVMIVLAFFVAEQVRTTGNVNVHWAITLGFAGFFCLFTGGMTGSSLQYVLVNTTSVEDLSRKVKVWSIAVFLPNPPPPGTLTCYQTVTYPLESMEPGKQNSTPPRTFAVLHSRPGENIFDLGAFENFKSVMGESFLDWVLPLKYSPCSDHSSGESAFPLGPAFQRMKKDAGIISPPDIASGRRRRRRHHRRNERRESRKAGDVPDDSG